MADTKTNPAGQQTRQVQSPQAMQQSTRGEQGIRRQGPDPFTLSPFEFMRRMNEEMDRIFGDFGFSRRAPMRQPASGSALTSQAIWAPRIEAFQQGDKFIVRAELPGLKKDDVEVNLTDDAITIQGQRQQEHRDEREGFYHSERSYGSFYREIPLPEGAIPDSADASFEDGVLEVRVQAPPHEVSRGRKLEISEGTGESGKQK
jgi:HSP20 family protein